MRSLRITAATIPRSRDRESHDVCGVTSPGSRACRGARDRIRHCKMPKYGHLWHSLGELLIRSSAHAFLYSRTHSLSLRPVLAHIPGISRAINAILFETQVDVRAAANSNDYSATALVYTSVLPVATEAWATSTCVQALDVSKDADQGARPVFGNDDVGPYCSSRAVTGYV